MTRALDLVEVPLAYTIDRTLDATPDFRKLEVVVPKHLSVTVPAWRRTSAQPLSPGGFSFFAPAVEAICAGQYSCGKGPWDVISDLYRY
jgi:hypothetical protein